MRQWNGKRVLVTGAAAGIGLALARRLAARGAHVILTDRDGTRLEQAAGAIRAAGGDAEDRVLDVTDGAAILEVRRAVREQGGPIDVLVNNAGVVHGGRFLEVAVSDHLQTMAVNANGLIAMTHAFLPDLLARPEAHLVNVASAAGFVGLPSASSYAASKAAVIGFSESIRIELARLGHRHVGVTTVCPLYVDTGMFEGARPLRTTGMLHPDRLAAQIVDAVERRRPFLRTPWLVELTPLLVGVLPVRLLDAVSAALGVTTSMERWTGHDHARPRA